MNVRANNTIQKDISVVIGFRNWGAERVRMAAQSILASFGKYKGEVIISDYGSDDPEPAKKVAEAVGAKYVYTPGDPVWSRSRALNAGFAIAEGETLVSTDADMLFSPESFSTIIEMVNRKKNIALFLQCRDLPEGMSAEDLAERESIDWRELEVVGRLRPRWGMGGMMAIHRDGMNAIRGFDERLHTYGGEDLDFALRARRAGYKTVWIDDPRVRMYHMWHEHSLKTVDQTPEGRAAVAYNKNVVYNDKTVIRNFLEWRKPLASVQPLVTVSIVTFNRGDLIADTIRSVLMQSVQDFEIVVIDDGSTDNTREVVESFADPRIRYIWQENAGIAVARNHAVKIANGQFIAVQDDDDLMHPRRLEWQLECITDGISGSVGSFVNFSNETGQTTLSISQMPSSNQLAVHGSTPGHSTWLVRTDLFRAIPYDETLTSGVDHNVLLRMIRSGARFVHCGKPVMLRRQHDKQVTITDGTVQGDSATQSLRFLRYYLDDKNIAALKEEHKGSYYPAIDDIKDKYLDIILPYLPDHLVKRKAWASFDDESVRKISSEKFDGSVTQELIRSSDKSDSFTVFVENATQRDLVTLAQLGKRMGAEVADEFSIEGNRSIDLQNAKTAFREKFGETQSCVIFPVDENSVQELIDELSETDVPWMSFLNSEDGIFICSVKGVDMVSKKPSIAFGVTSEDFVA